MVDQEMLTAMKKVIGMELHEELKGIKAKIEKLDGRTEDLESNMCQVKVMQVSNQVLQRQNSIERCYADTSARYLEQKERLDNLSKEVMSLNKMVNDKIRQQEEAQG